MAKLYISPTFLPLRSWVQSHPGSSLGAHWEFYFTESHTLILEHVSPLLSLVQCLIRIRIYFYQVIITRFHQVFTITVSWTHLKSINLIIKNLSSPSHGKTTFNHFFGSKRQYLWEWQCSTTWRYLIRREPTVQRNSTHQMATREELDRCQQLSHSDGMHVSICLFWIGGTSRLDPFSSL